jgi:hypothetical protein
MVGSTELVLYRAVPVFEGNELQWLSTQNGIIGYTVQSSITLDENYAITGQAPLVLPMDTTTIRGYCVSGENICMLTETQVLIYQGDTLISQQDGTWVAATAASRGF